MSISLISVTLNTSHLSLAAQFYSELGFQFETIPVKGGSEVLRARQGNIELCLFAVLAKKQSAVPNLQLGFKMDDLDKAYSKIKNITGVTILMEPTDMPDGRKAMVKDPDGNSIEMNCLT